MPAPSYAFSWGCAWLLAPAGIIDMMQLVGLVLFPVAYLTQRYRYDKVHGIALAKALGVSLCIGAPGIGLWVMLALGLMGAFVVYRRRAEQRSAIGA